MGTSAAGDRVKEGERAPAGPRPASDGAER
jgi:hypothetical protein